MAAALILAAACHKTPAKPSTPAIVGEWQLSSITVKSVEYAGQTIDVYLGFAQDGTCEVYQMIGQGRFYKYSGTWEISGKTLTGKYSSGKAWATSYEATVEGESLTLVSAKNGETDVYQKVTIPDEIKNEAYEK